METNEDKTQQNGGCSDSSGAGGECCSSGSGGWKNWKTALFILVILAAGAVAAHSLMTNGDKLSCGGNPSRPCPFDKPSVLNKPCVPDTVCVTYEADPNNVTCPFGKKANNPSSSCPTTAVPSCCPTTESPGCCPTTAVPSGCPKAGSD